VCTYQSVCLDDVVDQDSENQGHHHRRAVLPDTYTLLITLPTEEERFDANMLQELMAYLYADKVDSIIGHKELLA